MEKELTDVEKFAAMVADKQDNPTMHELAKTFPEKSYRELEKYRNEDREQEANQTPLTDAQKDLVEHLESAQIPLTESQKKQEELEPIEKGVCVPGELRKAREQAVNLMMGECKRLVKERDKEHKLRQEAEEALANALAINESHQKLNGNLRERVTELEAENKKLHDELNKRINNLRKSGL
tara:strand:+ start:46 stop:588 length:543 start_codon:yes stop_codon:yes gene_type:complete